MKPLMVLHRLVPFVSILGLVSLSYLLGAAALHFNLPSSAFLRNAFIGGQAWLKRQHANWDTPGPRKSGRSPDFLGEVETDRPDRTFDGFTLCTQVAPQAAWTMQATLVNMRGDVVHKWAIPFSRIWPNPPHLSREVHDDLVCFFGCHLFANGDLLVVLDGLENATCGYGLVKLDRDSNVIWKLADTIHHHVDVGPDGTIYAIKHEIRTDRPKGLEHLPAPFLADSLVMLSAEGKPLRQPIPLLETFRDSHYASMLSASEVPAEKDSGLNSLPAAFDFKENAHRRDPLHTNFVQVLTPELAPKFPQFKAGQLLISMRELDAIAVIDPDNASVIWAARGPWKAQHDPQFLSNGHLLLFDNRGSSRTSRVLEYDPKTRAFPWSYPAENGTPFKSHERGMSQRLPNGNTLIVNSVGCEILEVTPDRQLVWSFETPGSIHTGRRYNAEQLTFLSGGQRARP